MEKKIQKAASAVEQARTELAKRGALHSRAREALDVVDVDAKEFRNAYFAADAARIGVERASLALAAREGELEAAQRAKLEAQHADATRRANPSHMLETMAPTVARCVALRAELVKLSAVIVQAAGEQDAASREERRLSEELGRPSTTTCVGQWPIVDMIDRAHAAEQVRSGGYGSTPADLSTLAAHRLVMFGVSTNG